MGKMCSTCAVAFSRFHGRVPYLPTAGRSEFLTSLHVCEYKARISPECADVFVMREIKF